MVSMVENIGISTFKNSWITILLIRFTCLFVNGILYSHESGESQSTYKTLHMVTSLSSIESMNHRQTGPDLG